jgi:hypothetical protein
MKPTISAVVLAVAILQAAIASFASPSAVKKPAPKPDERLPAVARELVLGKMRAHRVDTALLLRSVVMLDRQSAALIAREIADDVQLARPTRQDAGQVNSLIPPRFFELQEALRDEATSLVRVLETGSDAAVAESYGRVVSSCVACHTTYLNPR